MAKEIQRIYSPIQYIETSIFEDCIEMNYLLLKVQSNYIYAHSPKGTKQRELECNMPEEDRDRENVSKYL